MVEVQLATSAKSVVTVQAVRVANGKLISGGKANLLPPSPPAKVAADIRKVSIGGQLAMQSVKK